MMENIIKLKTSVLQGVTAETLLNCQLPKISCLLLSGGTSAMAEHSFLAWDPLITISAKKDCITLSTNANKYKFRENPFDAVKTFLHNYCLSEETKAFGYFSYDLKNYIEKLPSTKSDNLNLPDLFLMIPRYIICHKQGNNYSELTEFSSTQIPSTCRLLLPDKVLKLKKPENIRSYGKFKPQMKKSDYFDAIRKIKSYLLDGHIYQVNFAQQFSCNFSGDSTFLFRELYKANPAPFFSFLNLKDFQILSTSPERFVKRNNENIESVPIKGTRPRKTNPDEDKKEKEELLSNIKEDSELSMIVDLIRNDFGKISVPGSVKLENHKQIESYSNVFQMMSTVKGKVKQNLSNIDILKALFPCGSITGCPKIRAMEIIDELEKTGRNIYTGAIGYLDSSCSMDLSVAIRTAVIHKEKLFFSVGGGIIFDSDATAEYKETLSKGKTFFQLLSELK